jgi:NAD(P)-dependent dehydrogenase (short-subunit alcohol dehydrogenase family)
MIDPLLADGTLDAGAIPGRIPAGRMADPSETADVVSLLAADRAMYVTGTVLPVEGGWSAYRYVQYQLWKPGAGRSRSSSAITPD